MFVKTGHIFSADSDARLSGFKFSPAPYHLCACGKVTQPFFASVSSSVKWELPYKVLENIKLVNLLCQILEALAHGKHATEVRLIIIVKL